MRFGLTLQRAVNLVGYRMPVKSKILDWLDRGHLKIVREGASFLFLDPGAS